VKKPVRSNQRAKPIPPEQLKLVTGGCPVTDDATLQAYQSCTNPADQR
jgi:hypothetical protein